MYYFRWPIPERLRVQLACKAGQEIRFSLRTNTRTTAIELSARHWLRCCDLLRSLENSLPVKDIIAAIKYVKDYAVSAALDSLPLDSPPPLELVSIVEHFGTLSSENLRAIVSYLLTKNVELFVQPPPTHSYNVLRMSDISLTWEPHDRWDDYILDYAIVPHELLYTLNGSDTFSLDEFRSYDLGYLRLVDGSWKATGQYKLVATPPFTRTLQQLFVRRTLPDHISAALRKSVTPPGTQVSAVPTTHQSKLLSVEIDNYHKRFTTPIGKDRKLPCSEKTATEMRAILTTFLDVVGDKPVTSIWS